MKLALDYYALDTERMSHYYLAMVMKAIACFAVLFAVWMLALVVIAVSIHFGLPVLR